MSSVVRSATGSQDPCSRQRLRALKRSIPRSRVKRIIRRCRPRARACPVAPDEMVVWLIVGLNLFCQDALRQVWRWLLPASKKLPVPQRNTLCAARQRLGCRVLLQLAGQVLRPLAKADTPDTCYKGMALRGIDTVSLSLADSPANRATFNPPRRPVSRRRRRRRPPCAYPQAKLGCLCELGTHAMLHWTLKPSYWADCNMAPPLLKRLETNALLLWDAGFYSWQNLRQVLQNQAHLLGRLTWSVKPQVLRVLSDGSYLARLPEGSRWGPVVRIIEYRLRGMPGGGRRRHKKHRLLTTLLNERQYPALELAELYHRRWEQELVIQELETYQRMQRVLVSQTPAGVLQEVAGLMIAHWLIRQLAFEASVKAGVCPTRISFTGTLKLLRCRLAEAGSTAQQQRRWWQRLVEEVAAEEVLEPRHRRSNPRVLKRTTFDFPKKKRADYRPRPPVPPFAAAFVLLR